MYYKNKGFAMNKSSKSILSERKYQDSNLTISMKSQLKYLFSYCNISFYFKNLSWDT